MTAHAIRYEPITVPLEVWLRLQGLEVTGASWGGAYPLLYTQRVVAPPLHPCGFCEHAQALHEGNGACLAIDCACEVYTPPLEGTDARS